MALRRQTHCEFSIVLVLTPRSKALSDTTKTEQTEMLQTSESQIGNAISGNITKLRLRF